MSHTFYNSLDSSCKSPFGAIPAGQAVTFNLTVPEDLGYVDPHLVLTKDRENPVHYRMEFTGQTPRVNHFTLTVTPTTSGLYFYHLTCTLISAVSTARRAAKGCSAGPRGRNGS